MRKMNERFITNNPKLMGKQSNITLLVPDATEVSSIDFGFSLVKLGLRLLILLNNLFNIYACHRRFQYFIIVPRTRISKFTHVCKQRKQTLPVSPVTLDFFTDAKVILLLHFQMAVNLKNCKTK